MHKKFLALLIALIAASSPFATHANEQVTVGDRTISIPPPSGFVRLDGKSGAVDAALKTLVGPANTSLAAFATPQNATALIAGKNVKLQRYFLLQTLTAGTGRKVTISDFKDAKKEITKMAGDGDTLEKAKTEANNVLKNRSVDLQVGSLRSLGVIESGDEFIETAMIMRSSQAEPPIAHVNSTVVANGKIIFAYGYSNYTSAADLEWTKAATKAWRQSILAANPGGTEQGGFDFSSVGRSALIGGVIGAIVTLFVRKKKQT